MLLRIGVILLFLLLLPISGVYAHPGNTDSSGGHTCRTNCEEWGLQYGEYHYHNNYPTVDHYSDGYNRGYELAYSYTSVCEEDYEWWWEGPQEFGNGYEAGIEDGHHDGLLVCFEESYQIGNEMGYDDFLNGFDYNEEPDLETDEESYRKGYTEGYAEAESEQSEETSTVSTNSIAFGNDTSAFESYVLSQEREEQMYEDGYDDGYETASKGYLYDDIISWHSDDESKIYKEGYYEGWIAGGGGSFWEDIWYWITKNPLIGTFVPIFIIILLVVVIILIRRMLKKTPRGTISEDKEYQTKATSTASSSSDATFLQALMPVLGIFVVGFLVIFGVAKFFSNTENPDSVNYVNDDNPYSYTSIDHDCSDFSTQKEAQLFYEANGGPSKDPHDLDRDNDGMACDWNP